jgi:hypothetical protein
MADWAYYDMDGNRVPPNSDRAVSKGKEIRIDSGVPAPAGHASLAATEYRDVHPINHPELRKTFGSYSKLKTWVREYADSETQQEKPKLATPPPHPTDVPDKQHVAFAIEHNGTKITAFANYVLLQQITIDIRAPLVMFRTNEEKLVAAAAAKYDAGKVDSDGWVRLAPGDSSADMAAGHRVRVRHLW